MTDPKVLACFKDNRKTCLVVGRVKIDNFHLVFSLIFLGRGAGGGVKCKRIFLSSIHVSFSARVAIDFQALAHFSGVTIPNFI